jgi:uncharacterized membrane protein YqjE
MVELLSLVGSFGRYAQAMGALAGEESREAAALGVRLLVMLLAALFFAAFGYILFAAFVLGVSWLWIVAGFTALHALLAYICARHVKIHSRTPIFEETRREVARDLESLRKSSAP